MGFADTRAMTTTDALFDATSYRDPDYDAACRLVAEMTGQDYHEVELLPGVPSSQFCPIAITLDRERWSAVDIPVDEFLTATPKDRTALMESYGGTSSAFAVELDRVFWPEFLTLGIDVLPEEAEDYIDSGEWGWSTGSDDTLARITTISDDLYGSGHPQEFIKRFDAGEFPSLHLVAA